MKHLMDDVRAFHEACDVPVLIKPTNPPIIRRDLRVALIQEELYELEKAVYTDDIVEVADALADLIYVTVGTALEYGIPLDRVWDEVHRSNMAKIDHATGKVHKRADGKVLKPEGWKPPDIAAIIGCY